MANFSFDPAAETRFLSPRIWLSALAGIAASLPFLSVRYPPITDLPQQMSQVRLFWDAIENADSLYIVQWSTPHLISHFVLVALTSLFGIDGAGRLGMWIIVIASLGVVHLIGATSRRPMGMVLLAGCFLFNHCIYWGFYSFVLGFAVFGLFLVADRHASWKPGWETPIFFALAALLYFTHALWFITAGLWLGVRVLVFRGSSGTLLRRGLGFVPFCVLGVVWRVSIRGTSFETPPQWEQSPLNRLLPSNLVDASFGGLRGTAEPLLLSLVFAWVALSLWQNREELRTKVDTQLLTLAGMFFVFYLLYPTKVLNTIHLNSRWLPIANIMLLLALPAPILRPFVKLLVPAAAWFSLCLQTTVAWKTFETLDLWGFKESLAAIPGGTRVAGLDMTRNSPTVKGHPYIQMVAYAQALKGNEINFSFAEHRSSAVVYREPRVHPFNYDLEWEPQRFSAPDIEYFDYVLINGIEEEHVRIQRTFSLKPVQPKGFWRLYGTLRE